MRVHVEESFMENALKVWIFERGSENAPASRIWRYDSGADAWTVEETDGLLLPDPSLVIPMTMVEALVPALAKMAPPDTGQAAHLEDAKEVRDRAIDFAMGLAQDLALRGLKEPS